MSTVVQYVVIVCSLTQSVNPESQKSFSNESHSSGLDSDGVVNLELVENCQR